MQTLRQRAVPAFGILLTSTSLAVFACVGEDPDVVPTPAS